MAGAENDPIRDQVFETIDAMRRALVMTLIDSC